MRNLFYTLILSCFIMQGCGNEPAEKVTVQPEQMEEQFPELKFDWQGHRGARGLSPENSFFGFIKAIENGVNTLELDIVVSSDKKAVVSHEPWMSSHICLDLEGKDIKDEKALNIYQMHSNDIRKYDCGTKPNSKYPEQEKMFSPKPLLENVIRVADDIKSRESKTPVRFNIEIKSRPEWDNTFTPPPAEFVDIVLGVAEKKLKGRLTMQSFDNRTLEELNKRKGNFKIAQLIENTEGLDANLGKLTFLPDIYCPYYMLVTKELVDAVHSKGMKIIPWTVNEEEAMRKLIELGVDGIITDYPDKIKLFKNE